MEAPAAPRSSLWRQISTLSNKNFRILLMRHNASTIYTAFVLPLVLTIYLGTGQNLNAPQDDYGIADPRPVRSLVDGLSAADNSRSNVVFVNNGHTGGDIERVIDSLSDDVSSAGKNATTVSDLTELAFICQTTFRGTSDCYGAVVFHSSPDEGDGGIWNYTLRADPVLGLQFRVDNDDNAPQVYTLPLQRAVDAAIARVNGSSSDSDSPLSNVRELPFTDETEEEREARVLRNYQNTFVNFLAVTFLLGFMGVIYHLPGHAATEREKGLTQLIDAMMPSAHDWEPQVARMFSNLYSFSLIYFPGWVIAAVIARLMLWKETNFGIVIIFLILTGFAFTSQGILGSTFFKKAQLSGVINALVFVLLGVLAQALPNPNTAVVAVLSLLFAPCAFIFFVIYIARFEGDGRGMSLLDAPPRSNSTLPGVVIWVFLLIQFLVYPLLAAFLERQIHGVASESRRVFQGGAADARPQEAVHIDSLTKVYRPSIFRRMFSFISKPREPTVAVNNLNLTAKRGQILALLGANGSGKSTTLDSIAGMSHFNQGNITIDASGGIGIAPQKNVLWDELTVFEHIRIFNELKSPRNRETKEQIHQLIEAIGLSSKLKSQAKTLSGGQKRKLQLGLMLTGGSAVCCVDEVSSGIDPLSRRKIWDILLSERGRRTIILTTHFLDEADLLADDIAILSKGSLRAQGSSVGLKDTLGAGYRVHVLNAKDIRNPPEVEGVSLQASTNTIVYTAPSSSLAADVIRVLEHAGIPYRMSSPTIEDVFLQVAEEVKDEKDLQRPQPSAMVSDDTGNDVSEKEVKARKELLGLQSGRQIGFFKQTFVLIRKRFTLLKTNWIPYLIAFLIPVVAGAAMQILIRDEEQASCSPGDPDRARDSGDFRELFDDAVFAVGPSSEISASTFTQLLAPLFEGLTGGGSGGGGGSDSGNISVETRNTYSGFEEYIEDNRRDINPGGFWVGGSGGEPTVAYRVDGFEGVFRAVIAQNLLSTVRTNISIATTYIPFDTFFAPSTIDTLQVAIYFSVAMCIAPCLFSLYPNVERRSHVRGLQYSSGVRSLPLWIAHLTFDWAIFLVAMVAAAIAFVVASDIWYAPGYLFPVFGLYAMCSILLSYVFSLILKSQVATFAAILAYNGVGFGIYLIGFFYIMTFSPATVVDRNILIGHYSMAAVFPIGSLSRAMFVGLNTFSMACHDNELRSYPGHINAYGGPIAYLAVQSLLLLGILLWHDSGNKIPAFMRRKHKVSQSEAEETYADQEVANELVRVETSSNEDGLQVKHLTKKFKKFTAVDNVTFGVRHGEVFALLGPNGAGKSTTISLIRGDLQPSRNGGGVFVEQISVTDQRALARSNLGVCPQFDAIDSMTVLEHLRHYARIRGITDVEHQIWAVVRAVGLDAHVNTMAQHLSGGNKRKLSLGIALTGNPSVILLDEPSSGLDAAAKRIMWRTLGTIVPGRSILLTTHSMEEADALASRAGILAKRMLAVGEVEQLQRRFGDSLYVHLVSRTAPHSTPEEMERIRSWLLDMFPGADVEPDTYHGQMRFSVPASEVMERCGRGQNKGSGNSSASAIGQLVVLLEENKEQLGIEHHSVSPTTLNDVFLSIVGQHNVQEEGYDKKEKKEHPLWMKIVFWPFIR